jgi:hypothetical protein
MHSENSVISKNWPMKQSPKWQKFTQSGENSPKVAKIRPTWRKFAQSVHPGPQPIVLQ